MTISPTGPALDLFLVSVVLGALSCVAVAARLVIRKRIKGIGLDDWLMLIGLVSVSEYVLIVTLSHQVIGLLHSHMHIDYCGFI
jgi:hypothetical protein